MKYIWAKQDNHFDNIKGEIGRKLLSVSRGPDEKGNPSIQIEVDGELSSEELKKLDFMFIDMVREGAEKHVVEEQIESVKAQLAKLESAKQPIQ